MTCARWLRRSCLRFVSTALLGTVALSGCARLPKFVPTGVLEAPGQSVSTCSLLVQRLVPPDSFRAMLDTSLSANDESYSFRYAVVDRGFQDLRIDLLPQEGAYTLGLLTVRNGRALLIDSEEKRYVSGCEPDQLFARFFGLYGITPDVVRALIVGQVPRLRCEDVRTYRQGAGQLQLLDGNAHRVWKVDESSGAVTGVEILDSGNERIHARAVRKETSGGPVITISIFKPVEASALIEVRRYTVNPQLSPTLFDVAPPRGYTQGSCG